MLRLQQVRFTLTEKESMVFVRVCMDEMHGNLMINLSFENFFELDKSDIEISTYSGCLKQLAPNSISSSQMM